MPELPTNTSLNEIPFGDRERAEKNFARVRSRVAKPVADAIPSLLADVPDPDAALNSFERLIEQENVELLRAFEKRRQLVHYALAVFGYSQYLGETLLHNPDLLPAMLRDENMGRSHSREEFRDALTLFRSRSTEPDLSQLLARFRRREYVRIMLRDVLELATMAETASEISALSDVLIEEALRACESQIRAKYGMPLHRDKQGRIVTTPFTVLALGKLGGNELNYSSDIDLMFLYGDGESLPDASITNREHFVKLAQLLTDVLSRVTKEGFVFRIDLRLRPQGREGESAVAVSQALRYYLETAEDWERQALIKVRHCAGDAGLARQFIRKVQDCVYTEQVNFTAIETALQARDRIHHRRKQVHGKGVDVKLDPGGIRDIEFLVQCLQRVYGGKERWLRSGGTLFSLQKLHDKQHISGSDFHQLSHSYEFLRTVEHRLQLRHGQQTHRLPASEEDLAILARSLGDETVSPENIVENVHSRMDAIAGIYQRIIHHQQQQTEEQAGEEFELRTMDLSFGRIPSDRQILHRLAAENPTLYEIASRGDFDAVTRRNLFRFLSSSFTSAERYAPIAGAPELLTNALPLFRWSEFLTAMLVQHPQDISDLADLRQALSRGQAGFSYAENPSTAGHSKAFKEYVTSDALAYSEKLALLRRRFRHRIFVSGARDIIEARPVFASFVDTTAAADEAIALSSAIAGSKGLAVMALGRLGTYEFDCLSDADLLFVRDADLSAEEAGKAAEGIMQMLSAYTQEGTIIAVDVRLRPHGNEGELTITPEQLASYLAEESQPWEAVTYTKLRFVAGDEQIADAINSAASVISARFANDAGLGARLREMRNKLEQSKVLDNFKTGRGGLYDIDFIVGYLLLRNGLHAAEGNTRQRIQRLGQLGLLSHDDLQVLLDGLDLWRTLEHVTRLATARPQRTMPVSENARRSVEGLVGRIYSAEVAADLDSRIESTRNAVRQVFEQTVRIGNMPELA